MNSIESELPPEGHMAAVNDIEMYYEIHGDGPPLVLLHGFFGGRAPMSNTSPRSRGSAA